MTKGMKNSCQIISRRNHQKETFLELVLTFCYAKYTFLADIKEQGPFWKYGCNDWKQSWEKILK